MGAPFLQVTLPPLPSQRMAGNGKGGGAALMAEIMRKEGHTRSDMQKIVSQIPHLAKCVLPL